MSCGQICPSYMCEYVLLVSVLQKIWQTALMHDQYQYMTYRKWEDVFINDFTADFFKNDYREQCRCLMSYNVI